MTKDNKHQNESNLETMAKMPDNLTCGEFEDIVRELWQMVKYCWK